MPTDKSYDEMSKEELIAALEAANATPAQKYDNELDAIKAEENPDEPFVTDDNAAEVFNWHWRKVIDKLMKGEVGYKAYAAAYDIDISKESGERVARANYSRLLTNANFKRLWNKVLVEAGWSEQNMDSTMLEMINDTTLDVRTRRALLKDWNELHGRIIKRTDVTSKGEQIPIAMVEMVGDDDEAEGDE